ncbi:YdhK family protein [Corynebacterium aquatimens]|uniref:YdhK family protein n=1 Tax=Corynebacterium TaxID=1716 RepID=UPI001F2D5FC9|nr:MULTISPECIES: YdhK family protein [Corynebacterium]QYH20395.1 YdhK family protein [Corynebacterium aquatimens]UIZ92300.1 YdhK family protein [Corynebacterium sp. CNCTC7651]
MTKIRTIAMVAAAAAASVIGIAGCASESAEPSTPVTGTSVPGGEGHGGHGGHDHPEDGGPAPEGIEEAADPKFPVGTEVILTADHMPGMEGAPATISGAFKTYTYAVTYTPTDGGEPVVNHKWVVQEELEGAGTQRLADGATAVILAEHMSGMKGAEATIESSTDETVYMVDIDTPDMTMKRHKWVVESEIQPK